MSSTALAVIAQPDVAQSFEAMRAHLSVKHMDAPRVVVSHDDKAQLHLAAMQLVFAAILLWHGLKAAPAGINAWACGHLLRIPQGFLITFSTSGLVGWMGFFTLTVLFIWR